jgi:hypothetical protein
LIERAFGDLDVREIYEAAWQPVVRGSLIEREHPTVSAVRGFDLATRR